MESTASAATQPRVIVGYNGGQESGDAIAFGARMAQDLGAHLTLAAAFPYLRAHAGSEAFELALGRKSDPLFAEAQSQLGPLIGGARARQRALGGFPVARLLSRLASDEEADLIVLGSTHRGPLTRALIGSTGERVVRAAPCPVAVVPRGYAGWRSSRIGVVGAAYDGTAGAKRAFRQAAAIAQAASARLRLVAVVEPIGVADIAYAGQTAAGPEPRFSRQLLERATDDVLESLPDNVDAEHVILSGDPAEVLIDDVADLLDVLVVGSHADAPILRAFLGSVSTPVVRSASCPVIVVPPHATPGFGAWDGEPAIRLALRGSRGARGSAEPMRDDLSGRPRNPTETRNADDGDDHDRHRGRGHAEPSGAAVHRLGASRR